MTLHWSQRARQHSARRREHTHAQIASRCPASGGTQCPLPGWMDLRVALPARFGSLFLVAELVFMLCMHKYWNI